MPNEIGVDEFIQLSEAIPVVDVRSPGEFEKGHIHGAINIPLFSNEERAVVGTKYKRVGRNEAILKGLDIVGPKLKEFAKQAKQLISANQLIVHCWRGGMRSKNMAWLFDLMGIKTYILKGGYKAYRIYGKSRFEAAKIIILGGMTGSGKTHILHQISDNGEQVIDLEGIAHHKGSAFGGFGEKAQPTNEQFENDLIYQWLKLDLSHSVWLEDESRSIGSNWIPVELFSQMRKAPVIKLEIEKSDRIKNLIKDYAKFDPELLEEGVLKIGKRLGGQNVKLAQESLKNGKLDIVADIVLNYYDKTYGFGLEKRESGSIFPFEFNSLETQIEKLIDFGNDIISSRIK